MCEWRLGIKLLSIFVLSSRIINIISFAIKVDAGRTRSHRATHKYLAAVAHSIHLLTSLSVANNIISVQPFVNAHSGKSLPFHCARPLCSLCDCWLASLKGFSCGSHHVLPLRRALAAKKGDKDLAAKRKRSGNTWLPRMLTGFLHHQDNSTWKEK